MPIREGELLSIVWSDLDLDRDRLVLAEPEKGGIARTLLLPERAVRALRAHRARQAEVVRRWSARHQAPHLSTKNGRLEEGALGMGSESVHPFSGRTRPDVRGRQRTLA